MITMPSSLKDLESPETAADIERYLASSVSGARDRIALMRLAWTSSVRNSATATSNTRSSTAAPPSWLSRTCTGTTTSSARPTWSIALWRCRPCDERGGRDRPGEGPPRNGPRRRHRLYRPRSACGARHVRDRRHHRHRGKRWRTDRGDCQLVQFRFARSAAGAVQHRTQRQGLRSLEQRRALRHQRARSVATRPVQPFRPSAR